MTAYGDILWRPSAARMAQSAMARFADVVARTYGASLPTPTDPACHPALHRWSLEHTAEFWSAVAAFCGVRWQTAPATSWRPPPTGHLRGGAFFPGARLNFAENLLQPPGGSGADDLALTALAEGEAGLERRTLTRGELRRQVERAAAALQQAGVGPGDRVAGVLGNLPEAVIAMLATASLGAIWSSCSPDFGASAIVDRLRQVEPKVLFFTAAYRYGGKLCDVRATIRTALAELPSVTTAVAVAHLHHRQGAETAVQDGWRVWNDFLDTAPPTPLSFAPMAFDAPLYIMFSSGTTGVPKCIVHGVGGTLLQHKKELLLHSDIGPGARLLYFTTCGWMMWNWMVSALSTGASLVLFEGAVAQPDLGTLWRVVRDERVTAFGTSPKFVSTCMTQGLSAKSVLGGHQLRTLLSTGSPLLPEHFAWLYQELGDVHLASISGGTDIISCFMLGTPLLPVRAGEIQYAGLGMAVDAWDQDGRPVRGEKGELVCTRPFPSMPVGFWNDPGDKKYRDAYFNHFVDHPQGEVWRHGDFIEITATGGIVVYGRSDATLNPGGVRIGTAELYRQIEAVPEVVDSIAVGRREGDDTVIVLFVKLKPGMTLDDALVERLKKTVRTHLTPRHVPKEILQVQDIPYTRSGKKVELAVTQAIHGEPVRNLSALANPECMAEFERHRN